MDMNYRIIENGDVYGLSNSIKATERMVEIYDNKYCNQKSFGGLGQFVARYNAETLLAIDVGNGLCLNGSVPQWTLDAEQVQEIKDALGA